MLSVSVVEVKTHLCVPVRADVFWVLHSEFDSLRFIFYFFYNNNFIQQGCTAFIKSDSKVIFVKLQKISISDKCCSFELSI